MEETQNQAEPVSRKKIKKKFVYLDKYEIYKQEMEARISILERSLNASYIVIGILAVWVILLTIKS